MWEPSVSGFNYLTGPLYLRFGSVRSVRCSLHVSNCCSLCLPAARLEGKHLPLPPAMNGTQWGQATMARNLERGCPSNKPCANVICPDPFECVDLWNEYECT